MSKEPFLPCDSVCLSLKKFKLSLLIASNTMSQETHKTPPEGENIQEQEQTNGESLADKTVDPRDLVMKPNYTADQNPQEVVNNPAVTPEMANDPGDLRDDLRRD